MAKGKGQGNLNEPVQPPKGFKAYASDSGKFYELNPGESVSGVFLGLRRATIKDRRTHQMKEINVYRIRQDDETVVNLGGRTLLDRQFADAIDDMYLGEADKARGVRIIINRLPDSRTADNNPLGMYQLFLQDPSQVVE